MRRRVLLADDSSMMRAIIRRSLESSGNVETTEAVDGSQVLALFRPGDFDLVLSDWNMPGMCGAELIEQLRGLDRHVPIIVVTNEAEKARVLAAREAGVSDYLLKPFTSDVLRAKLAQYGCWTPEGSSSS